MGTEGEAEGFLEREPPTRFRIRDGDNNRESSICGPDSHDFTEKYRPSGLRAGEKLAATEEARRT